METNTATIETLTAEVRVLMVGRRQVTLSVYRQLDRYDASLIEPFGRIRDSRDKDSRRIYVVGCTPGGVLARSDTSIYPTPVDCIWTRSELDGFSEERLALEAHLYELHCRRAEEWPALPLIVLAGLT